MKIALRLLSPFPSGSYAVLWGCPSPPSPARAVHIDSLFLVEAPGHAAVERFNRADPFHAAGIWDKVTITRFNRRQG
jgi:hypothetical protein